jgi:hypothetical protein
MGCGYLIGPRSVFGGRKPLTCINFPTVTTRQQVYCFGIRSAFKGLRCGGPESRYVSSTWSP